MSTKNNKQRVKKIKKLIEDFCDANLDNVYKTFILNLLDTACREKFINNHGGKNEVIAASLINVIARLNFLYDNNNADNPNHITMDTLSDFFQLHKSTIRINTNKLTEAIEIRIGPEYSNSDIMDINTFFEKSNRAKQIAKANDIPIDLPDYSNSDIMDIKTFFEKNNDLSRKKNMSMDFMDEFVVETASDEESAEIERFMADKIRLEEEKLLKKKARRLEINRMIAEKKKAKKKESTHKQLKLFDV